MAQNFFKSLLHLPTSDVLMFNSYLQKFTLYNVCKITLNTVFSTVHFGILGWIKKKPQNIHILAIRMFQDPMECIFDSILCMCWLDMIHILPEDLHVCSADEVGGWCMNERELCSLNL